MTTTKCFGTLFIARKSDTDLKIHLSDNEPETGRQTNIPIHRPPDIHDGHISMDTLSDMGRRYRNKVFDTFGGRNAGDRVPCTHCYNLGP